jgi:RNA polymerase sigma-70 factor, ECF subfamily
MPGRDEGEPHSTFAARAPILRAVGVDPDRTEPEPLPPWSTLQGFLRRLFLTLGAQSHDAEDLAQESLARVIGRRDGKGLPVSLGFAATVGRNLWRDRLRVRMRRAGQETVAPGEEVPDRGASPPELATRKEDDQRIEAAIASLDPRHRDAIVLVILECKSYAEAALILDVPRGTVKSRVHYGIQRLRARLCPSQTRVIDDRRTEC